MIRDRSFSVIRAASALAGLVVVAACSGSPAQPPQGSSSPPSQSAALATRILEAESDAGVGAVVWDDDVLVVYVHADRISESMKALRERVEATYDVAVDVRPGAPVPATT